ncbi:histone-lysine N-methyltransferase SETMAR [Trichonephila clavipes]|nr:histone-lysine N-methyltransferase SETMAR [Trichonephila clavipes]
MDVNKEKIRFILQFFFDKGENASQVAELRMVYISDSQSGLYRPPGVYCDLQGVHASEKIIWGSMTCNWGSMLITCNFSFVDSVQVFLIRCTGRPVVKNVDKITEIIEVGRHVSSRSIAQELKIDHKTVLKHLRKAGFKRKLHVWVPHQLTPKNMMDRISICEALAKRNEIDPFLKRMVTGDEKWVTYDNIVRKRSWSKCGKAAQNGGQTRANGQEGSTANLVERNHLLGVASAWSNTK